MFDLVSWGFRYAFIFLVIGFAALSYLSYFKDKTFLKKLLPFFNLLFILSIFAFISYYYEFQDLMPVYIGAGLFVTFLLFRVILAKGFKVKDLMLYDLTGLLIAVGLSILYRLNPDFAIKQVIFIFIGNIALITIFWIANRRTIQPKDAIFFGLTILFFLILTQLFGTQVNGSRNWIKVFFFKFQPSELLKILFVYFLACTLHTEITLKKFIGVFSSVVVIAVFFALQKDLGSAFIFFAIFLIMLGLSDGKLYYTLISTIAAGLGAVASYLAFGHIRSRVLAWANPWKYISGKSYQITQSLFAVATGGLFGTGLYLGKPEFIPAIQTDFIFSAICEETGILSAIAIISIYALITIISLEISRQSKDSINQLAAAGLASLTGIQTLLIICGVLNIIPITGVTLPFISYGGTSILSQFINLGLLFYLQEKVRSEQNES